MSEEVKPTGEEFDVLSKVIYSAAVMTSESPEDLKLFLDRIDKDDKLLQFITNFGALVCEEQKKICSEFFPEDKRSIYLEASRNVLEQS